MEKRGKQELMEMLREEGKKAGIEPVKIFLMKTSVLKKLSVWEF